MVPNRGRAARHPALYTVPAAGSRPARQRLVPAHCQRAWRLPDLALRLLRRRTALAMAMNSPLPVAAPAGSASGKQDFLEANPYWDQTNVPVNTCAPPTASAHPSSTPVGKHATRSTSGRSVEARRGAGAASHRR